MILAPQVLLYNVLFIIELFEEADRYIPDWPLNMVLLNKMLFGEVVEKMLSWVILNTKLADITDPGELTEYIPRTFLYASLPDIVLFGEFDM